MDLGRINVRGQSVNLLWQAIHPQHGLVWSTDKSILLEKIHIHNDQVENNEPLTLGKFQHAVHSVHWSSNVGEHVCYLCVVHSEHVSIWKVSGLVPRLSFKQVRKLNVQPIQQGCLWNPGRDILCVLSRQQCSFFYSHTENKGSLAFPPVDSGKFKCGTWTKDGNRLVISHEANLLIYAWPNIDESMKDYSAVIWKIPCLSGCVNSIIPLSDTVVLCAAELPLESLCKIKDSFIVPELEEIKEQEQGEIISPKKSITDTLLNLPRNPQNEIESSTQLISVDVGNVQCPNQVSVTGVKGVLCPELLLYLPESHSIVVGSNTQYLLQVFTFDEGNVTSNLIKTTEIRLDKQERPKGISQLLPPLSQQTGILVTVGKRASSDSAFLTSSSGSAMEIKLKFYPFSIDDSILRASKVKGELRTSQKSEVTEENNIVKLNGHSHESSSNNNTMVSCNQDLSVKRQETVTEMRDFSESDSSESSPRNIVIGNLSRQDRKSLIEDLSGHCENDIEIEKADFSEKPPCFQNNLEQAFRDSIEDHMTKSIEIKEESKVQAVTKSHDLNDSAVSMATSGISMTTSISNETKVERMQLDIDKLNHRIDELKLKVQHLTDLIKESTIITKYQSQEEPEKVMLECKVSGLETKQKSFLLDNGRLQYDSVKRTFDLETLEIYIDGEPCVVSGNIDGYIPIRFKPATTIIITGKTVIKNSHPAL